MNAMNSLLAEGVIGWEEMEAAVGSAATMQETDGAYQHTGRGADARRRVGKLSDHRRHGTYSGIDGAGRHRRVADPGPALTATFRALARVSAGLSRMIRWANGELFTVFEDGSSVLGGIFRRSAWARKRQMRWRPD